MRLMEIDVNYLEFELRRCGEYRVLDLDYEIVQRYKDIYIAVFVFSIYKRSYRNIII